MQLVTTNMQITVTVHATGNISSVIQTQEVKGSAVSCCREVWGGALAANAFWA